MKFFSVWLIPSEETYKLFSQKILDVCKNKKHPYFEPHCTLFCGKTNHNKLEIIRLFKKNALNSKVIATKTSQIQWGYDFYKSFFIELENNTSLAGMSKMFTELDEESSYKFIPHLSLSYGTHLEKENIDILVPKIIHFNQLKLVTDSPEKSFSAIRSWRTLDTIELF